MSYDSGTAPVRHFKLVVEPADGAGSLQVRTLGAQAARGGQIVINYELTSAAAVSAEIRNIAGRPVRSLVAGRAVEPGPQTLTWNGASDAGSAVPNGTYLLHLSAKAPDGQAVKRILPIHAAR